MIVLYCCVQLVACAAANGKGRHKDDSALEVAGGVLAANNFPEQAQRFVEHSKQEGPTPIMMRRDLSMSISPQTPVARQHGNSSKNDSAMETAEMTFRSWQSLWKNKIRNGFFVSANATIRKLGNWGDWEEGQCGGRRGRPLFRTRKDMGTPGNPAGCLSLCSYREDVASCEYDERSGVCYSFKEIPDGVVGDSGKCALKLPSDCEWSDWRNGDCSTTCGPGKMDRTRRIRLPAAMGGVCEGTSKETDVDCEEEECTTTTTELEEEGNGTDIEAGAQHGAPVRGCVVTSAFVVGLSSFFPTA